MKARLTISKSNWNQIHIEVDDENSRIRVLTGTMTLENFAQVITGLGHVEFEVEYGPLAQGNIGKYCVRESRIAHYKGREHDRKKLEEWLLETQQEKGWTINPYLNSQSSVHYDHANTTTVLRYSVFKYVDEEPKENK